MRWGATLGGRGRSRKGIEEGVTREKLWVAVSALGASENGVRGKVAHANFGALHSWVLTALASRLKGPETRVRSALVALHISGQGNSVADSLSCQASQVPGCDPYPDRVLRQNVRDAVHERFGCMDVGTIASDDGSNAFEGPLGNCDDLSIPHRIVPSKAPWATASVPDA